MTRRMLLAMAAGTYAGVLVPGGLQAQEKTPSYVETTGSGRWRYKKILNWGSLPAGTSFGGTHGGIATDRAGRVYVSTQSQTGVLVYGADGRLLKTIANQYPEVHSIVCVEERDKEYLYVTIQKGTTQENWLFVKMTTEGVPVMKITAPPEAGFQTPNQWRLTAAIVAPDGDIWIANGYGDSRLFRFDKTGSFKASYAGKGSSDGLFNCSHGLAVDTRYDQPLLMVCDRENRRLVHMDFDGKFVRTLTLHLRRPCQISFHGDYAFISELEGRVTVLDKDNVPVAFLGDNPMQEQWAKYDLGTDKILPAVFSAAHGCHVDASGALYVSDWNKTGRLSKFELVRDI